MTHRSRDLTVVHARVDKTRYIQRLIDEGTHYFLSRPAPLRQEPAPRHDQGACSRATNRYSGGFTSTTAGTGRNATRWCGSTSAAAAFAQPGLLEANVMEQLAAAERRLAVTSEYLTAPGRFAYLLEALHRHTGRTVVVLVDEYDKPILDTLSTPETALANRDYLRGLYGMNQVERRSRPVHVGDGSEQVQQGEHLLGLEQSHRHHPGPPLPGDLRIY